MMEVGDFLKWVLNRDKLEIADYLDKMGQPILSGAATGSANSRRSDPYVGFDRFNVRVAALTPNRVFG